MSRSISISTFEKLTRPALGKELSRVGTGHLATLMLELGRLRRRGPSIKGYRPLKGEFSIIMEWEWRAESARGIKFGSQSGDRQMENQIKRLEGIEVKNLTVEGRIPELVLELSNGLWIRSCTTAPGQPNWMLFLQDGSCLSVERGVIVREGSLQ